MNYTPNFISEDVLFSRSRENSMGAIYRLNGQWLGTCYHMPFDECKSVAVKRANEYQESLRLVFETPSITYSLTVRPNHKKRYFRRSPR